MSGVAEPWGPGFDPGIGALVLPFGSAAVAAALFVAFCVLVLRRAGRDEMVQALARAGLLLLVGAAVAWVLLDAVSAATLAAQRRALDAHLLEMTTRAVMPGSGLACLDATAGELVEESCEKALFASPEATAASVAYVAAQISLLAEGTEYERRSGTSYESMLGGLRRALEIDRFGIVAHVLADRDGCTAARCDTFRLLRDTRQVSDNLTERKYDTNVMRHASEWLQSALSLVAANSTPASPPPAPAPLPPAQNSTSVASAKPNGLFFPSSASIPPVSIMAPEPTGPPQQSAAPADGSGKTPPAVTHKPVPSSQQAHRPANPAAPGRPAAVPEQAGDQ
jgi:hypothetical protein